MNDIPLALYVHLPWCVRKCPYCDFNSHAADPHGVPAEAYVDALLRDLATDAPLARGRPVSSIVIGGGTPSLFPGPAIARLLEGVRGQFDLALDAEITLEANPGTVDEANFHGYRAAGVNRLSLGVQSLRAAPLAALGRIHGVGDVARAVAVARAAGFTNLNLDLMHGLPGDRSGDALSDLAAALAFQPEHLSWYELTLEEGTPFARRPPVLPDEDEVALDFERGLGALEAAGFTRYEVSAYARDGRACRHNLNYWQFGDYLGIGAGAHGKLTTPGGVVRSVRRRHPAAYMKAAGTPEARQIERVEVDALPGEFMLNALRLAEGFEWTLFESRTGLARAVLEAPVAQAFQRGWVDGDGERLRPTAAGYRFLNDLQILFLDTPTRALPTQKPARNPSTSRAQSLPWP